MNKSKMRIWFDKQLASAKEDSALLKEVGTILLAEEEAIKDVETNEEDKVVSIDFDAFKEFIEANLPVGKGKFGYELEVLEDGSMSWSLAPMKETIEEESPEDKEIRELKEKEDADKLVADKDKEIKEAVEAEEVKLSEANNKAILLLKESHDKEIVALKAAIKSSIVDAPNKPEVKSTDTQRAYALISK